MTAPAIVPRSYRSNPNVVTATGSAVQEVPNMDPNQGSQWSPTVANLLVLIVIEMAAYAVISYVFRKVL